MGMGKLRNGGEGQIMKFQSRDYTESKTGYRRSQVHQTAGIEE